MIVFENQGLIDVAAITTMGVSVKTEGAIGYFGTGLKFSIATILRGGGSVVIWRGEERLEFGLEAVTIRGQEFELVTMNGQQLGFTSQLGRDWEPWMAYRELATNCQDEGGTVVKPGKAPASMFGAKEGSTVIIVEGLDDVWPERGTILLGSQPIAVNDVLEVHEGKSQYVYYRGVRIFTSPLPLAYTYNVLERMDLTEDRTAKAWYLVEVQLQRGIMRLHDKAIIRRILTCGELCAEHYMEFYSSGVNDQDFVDMARSLTLGGAAEHSLNPKVAESTRAQAARNMEPGTAASLTSAQQLMLDRATMMLEKGGFEVGDFPLVICETLGPGIHGLALDGKIYLSLLPFGKGTREVAATLLEEFSHLKSGHGDETRSLQDWLFDRLLGQIEEIAGEPF